jgi:hypothetical protein
LRFAEHRLDGDPHQHLVEVGGKGFAAPFVLAVEQVAALFDLHDQALAAAFQCGLPQHPVAHHGFTLLATGVADQALALFVFDDDVAAVRGDDQAALALAGVGVFALGLAQGRVVTVALHACMAARRSEAGGWE